MEANSNVYSILYYFYFIYTLDLQGFHSCECDIVILYLTLTWRLLVLVPRNMTLYFPPSDLTYLHKYDVDARFRHIMCTTVRIWWSSES